MASKGSFHSRIFFLCPHCKKAQRSLPGHLRKMCMPDSTEAEIQATVIEAKKELSRLSLKGRFWEYQQIRDILANVDPLARMLEEMQKKGVVVMNVPPVLPAPTPLAPSLPVTVPQRSGEGATEPSSKESSGEYYQSTVGPRWSDEVRVEMREKGLYNKHSIDHPLLLGFNQYLHVDLGNRRSKQEVENVSRIMYYVDPKEPNLSFVREVEKVREYFNVLGQTKLAQQTRLNYWKSLNRFMKYTITSTDIRAKDSSLFEDCKNFMYPLEGIRAGMSKKVNKELTQKRFHGYGKEKLPADCVTILDVAHVDFLAVMGKLQGPDAVSGLTLTKNESLLVLYYLEAIIMLKLLQRPGVVTNMTVEEWEGRTRTPNGCSVAVKEHKTAASQVAEIPLTDDQEHWFGLYFNEIRPAMLQGNKSGDDATVEGRFFVSSTGKPIHNACNDLKRLHAKYNIPKVTSGDARTAFETAAKNLPEVERNAVARLLGHTPETAEKHHRMRTPTDAFLAQAVIDQIAGKTRHGFGGACSREQILDERTAYNSLVQSCPVTLDGPPPKKARRQELCAEHERHSYDCWRSDQLKLRQQRVLEHFGRRQPSESRVDAWMEKQGWTTNVPQASLMLSQWEPYGTVDSALDSGFVSKMVDMQQWKGLVVRDVPGKGRGVFTKRSFKEGEVICDYHGRQVSREEGMKIRASAADMTPGYMFFYKNKASKDMCLDAREDSCQCHPLKVTYGRLIRHSCKRANICPRLFVHNDRDVILFIGSRDIPGDEELLFDYGLRRKSFAGEGVVLNWTC